MEANIDCLKCYFATKLHLKAKNLEKLVEESSDKNLASLLVSPNFQLSILSTTIPQSHHSITQLQPLNESSLFQSISLFIVSTNKFSSFSSH
jgi:hypothetical protein